MSVVPHKKAKLDALGLATLLAAHPVTRDTLNEVLDDYESCKAFIMYLKAAVELQDHGYDMENKMPKPYFETGVGIENIFRLLRLDAIWRLSYLDHPNIPKFGLRLSLWLQF